MHITHFNFIFQSIVQVLQTVTNYVTTIAFFYNIIVLTASNYWNILEPIITHCTTYRIHLIV